MMQYRMIPAGVISLIIVVCMVSLVTSQQTTTDQNVPTVPVVVLKGNDANVCPSVELRQEARQNLSAVVRSVLSGEVIIPQCGSGGWRRVVSIDTSDPDQQCPSPWEKVLSPAMLCARPTANAGCDEVSFSVGAEYSRVCGKITGVVLGSPDAYAAHGPRDEENYVDGISLTHSLPRQHIWTFAAFGAINDAGFVYCPCTTRSTSDIVTPAFVGDNYFCDTASNGGIWDGEDCITALSCCNFNSPPWFSVRLPQATSDPIDIRICGDEATSNENMGINELEIYVQ